MGRARKPTIILTISHNAVCRDTGIHWWRGILRRLKEKPKFRSEFVVIRCLFFSVTETLTVTSPLAVYRGLCRVLEISVGIFDRIIDKILNAKKVLTIKSRIYREIIIESPLRE